MKIYNYTGGTRGEAATSNEAEIRLLSGTLFSDIGKKVPRGETVELEVGIGPLFVEIYHESEQAIQMVEGAEKNLSKERIKQVILAVCKQHIENQELAVMVAQIIHDGFGYREVKFRVENINNNIASYFGHNGNVMAC